MVKRGPDAPQGGTASAGGERTESGPNPGGATLGAPPGMYKTCCGRCGVHFGATFQIPFEK